MRDKLKSPRFWAAVIGAAAIALQAFGVRIPLPVINECVGAVSAVLVFFGFIEPPKKDGPPTGEAPQEKPQDGGDPSDGE